MTINEIRNLYPYISTGRIYFNHASTAPISTRVLDAVNQRLKLSSEGEVDDFLKFMEVQSLAKAKLATLINSVPERIAFIDNTTNGINIIAQGLNLQAGDEIILNDLEFPANVYPFMSLEKEGVVVKFAKSTEGFVRIEDITRLVSKKTKVISVSQVQFLTGHRINLTKLGSFCKENNIIFCVDAIQGLGAVTLDVQRDQIDFLSCGLQKWMMGLQGSAFIYISEELQNRYNYRSLGWLSVENAWDLLNYKAAPLKNASAFQYGTINTLGVFAINAALDTILDFGVMKVEELILKNTRYFVNELQKLGIKCFAEGFEHDEVSGIISFKTDKADDILLKLNKANLNAAVREGIVRFSPHYYNTSDDIDKAVDLLKSVY